jgi:adenylate cyclase
LGTERHEVQRRLAAVAFADVAGFSRLVEANDVETTRRWKALRHDLLEPKIHEHHGKLLRVIGDALFVEFGSAVDAVQWAHDVQRALADPGVEPVGEPANEAIQLRIGINVEDVMVDGDDLHGDGVNIAARVQQLAKPGETLVTAAVYEYVWNKVGIAMTDLGEQAFKNIRRPIRVYKLETTNAGVAPSTRAQSYLSWTNRPSIAVLPFRTVGGVAGEEYFGEGITEEIIGALARSRSLFVIARHSTLQYRNRTSDMKQIAAELGVRYIVDGSVRKGASRLRISCELIDANLNRTIWAERYDGATEDVFELQDEMAARIGATIEPRVYEAEVARIRGKPTENLDSYDCLLRALSLFYPLEDPTFLQAGAYLDRAIELDGAYAQAHAYKAWWYVLLSGEGLTKDFERDVAAADAESQLAVSLDPNDAFALAVAAHIQAFLHKRVELASEMFERAHRLNPNSAFAWGISGSTCCFMGHPEEALERLRIASKLSPFDPLNFFFWTVGGLAEFVAGRYDQAVGWLRKARRANPRFRAAHRTLAASLGQMNLAAEAQVAARDLLAVDPGFRISGLISWYPLREPDLNRFADGLRAAGLPE